MVKKYEKKFLSVQLWERKDSAILKVTGEDRVVCRELQRPMQNTKWRS